MEPPSRTSTAGPKPPTYSPNVSESMSIILVSDEIWREDVYLHLKKCESQIKVQDPNPVPMPHAVVVSSI